MKRPLTQRQKRGLLAMMNGGMARGNLADNPIFWDGTGKRDCKLFKPI